MGVAEVNIQGFTECTATATGASDKPMPGFTTKGAAIVPRRPNKQGKNKEMVITDGSLQTCSLFILI
jgi:hypothetical protein